MGRILKNKNNEIRSGYKVVLFYLIYLILTSMCLGLLMSTISIVLFGDMPGGEAILEAKNFLVNTELGLLLSKIIETIVVFITIFILLKGFDNKSIRNIGFNSIKDNLRGLVFGMVLGVVSMAIIFFILLISKNIILSNSLVKPNFTKDILIGIPLFILVAISEEIMCRGYILNTINQLRKPWLAAILSSAIFAALHLGNPNVKVVGVLNIFLVGVLFAYMYIRTGSLWMPIGYHFTWNYFQGNIFGFPVSGLIQSEGLYVIKKVEENIFTGGSFGPEAGILSTLVIIAGIAVVWIATDSK